MKLTREVQIWIVIGVVVIIVLYGFFWYVYRPLGNTINNSYAELQDKKAKLDNAREVAKQYDQAKFMGDQLAKLQLYLQNKLPQTIDYTTLLKEITLLTASNGIVNTTHNTPKKTVKKSIESVDYNVMYIDMTISTNYHNFCNFLSKISASPIPISVFVNTMSYVAGTGKEQNLNITLTLLSYTIASPASTEAK